MKEGVAIARPILERVGLSPAYIQEILRLVGMHDSLDLVSTPEEQLLFEADSLGQVDIDRVRSTFKEKSDRAAFIRSFAAKRAPRFKTVTGKKFLAELLPKAEAFYCQ